MHRTLFDLSVPNIGRIAADGLVHARDLLGFIFVRFFTPRSIAREIVISAERRFDFLRWLRIVEEMVRRVLFIEASAIATSLPPPSEPRARSSAPRKPAPVFDRYDVATWRPSFRMTPYATHARPSRQQRAKHEPRALLPSRPLARRMRAVLLAVVDPHPFIERLARRLRRGLDRFRSLTTSKPCFHGRADPTLRDLSAECASRFADTS